jgi:hypothetical protein
MRIDREHLRKLESAFTGDSIRLDVQFTAAAMHRLTMWERGLLMDCLGRATAAKKPTREQRVLLAMFMHNTEEAAHG